MACFSPNAGRPVADRRETAHQRALGLGAGGQNDVADISAQQSRKRQGREYRMPVRVDQARHESPPAAVDHVRVVWRGRVSLGHGLDPTALDEQAEAIAQCVRLAVEQTEIRRIGRAGGPAAACALARGRASDATEAPTPATKPRRESSRSIRRAIERTCGVQQLQPTWGAASALSSAGVHAYMSDPRIVSWGAASVSTGGRPAQEMGHDRGAPLFTIR